jgi:antitoxin ParD1/3/4
MTVSYTSPDGGLQGLSMAAPQKRTFSLPTEQANYIDALVASGTYASASEVVRGGLRALQERDAVAERWLREEVVPVYDAMQADPTRGLSADEVLSAIESRHAARVKKATRDP